MSIVPFVLLVLSFQAELPPPQVPTLAVISGKFAPLEASTNSSVGIDLASLRQRGDGQITADAYFYNKDPDVTPVEGVRYSSVLASHMTRASVAVECSVGRIKVTQWTRLTDQGYSVAEIPSDLAPTTPQPSSPWASLIKATCSTAEREALPAVDSFVVFHQRMAVIQNNEALRRMAGKT